MEVDGSQLAFSISTALGSDNSPHVSILLPESVFCGVTENRLGNNGLCQRNPKKGALPKFGNSQKVGSESLWSWLFSQGRDVL